MAKGFLRRWRFPIRYIGISPQIFGHPGIDWKKGWEFVWDGGCYNVIHEMADVEKQFAVSGNAVRRPKS